jgi:hypothetical protein
LEIKDILREWIELLINSYPKLQLSEMRYLLSDFTDEMQTRMREDNKYAISLLMPNKIVLCHSSYAGQTITPNWDTIPRMLDTGNILRFISFTYDKINFKVKYWERDKSQLFFKWLGLSQASGFLTGGPFKIQVRIEDVIGEFQFDEDDLESFLVKHPELYTGVITLNVDPKRLTIEKLMLGQKEYNTATDFIQGYKAQKNNVPHFQKLYKTFGKDVFWIKYWDCKNEILCDDAGITRCVAKKPSPGDIIFANGNNILFQDSYLTDLVNRIINGESLFSNRRMGLEEAD